ncbi:MAG: hypothetical protein ABJC74_17710 [Gemmatimonadota bacterium]
MRNRMVWLPTLATAAVLGLACSSDSTAPPPPPAGHYQSIEVGDTISSSVAGSDSSWYVFHAPMDGQAQVYMQVTSSPFQFRASVGDSGISVFTDFGGSGSSRPLLSNGSVPFPVHAGEAIAIKIRNQTSAGFELRLFVAVFSSAPEHTPDTLIVGQVYETETIPLSADQDVFHFHGIASHFYSVAIQPIHTVAPGLFRVQWFDSAGTFLGEAAAGSADTALDANTTFPLEALTNRLYTIKVDYGNEFMPGAALRPGGYRLKVRDIPATVETGDSVLVPNDTLVSALETTADVDQFVLQGHAGDSVIVFVQSAITGPQAGTVTQLYSPEGALVTGEVLATGDTGLFQHGLGLITFAETGTYHVLVRGADPKDRGSYKLYVYPIDHAPENVSATLTPGDTVSGETIELAGDEDVFHFSAEAGQYFNLFAQVTAPSGPPLQLLVYDTGDTAFKAASTEPGPGGLFDHGSGRFQATGSGRYTVRVSAPTGARNYPYRLYLYQIDTLPEHTPANLAVGDSIVGERLELPGDIDLYHLTSTGSDAISLRARKADTDPSRFYLTISNQSGDFIYGDALPFQADSAGDSVGVAVGFPAPAGTYVMRVTDEFGISRPGARYDLSTVAVSYAPEGVPSVIVPGQVINESLAPYGDNDLYHFTAGVGQAFDLLVDSLPGHAIPTFIVQQPDQAVVTTLNSDLHTLHTSRFDPAVTGTYSVLVAQGTGPYRFHLALVDTLPEHVTAAHSIGDSVVGEAIDTPGDVDRYTFSGTPGSEVVIWARPVPFPTGDPRFLTQLLASSGDSVAAQAYYLASTLDPVIVPASGQLRIQIEQQRYGDGVPFTAVGPYVLMVSVVNRAPETAPAALTLGDTVKAESIDRIGDVDEFSFSGAAGQAVHLYSLPNVAATLIDQSTLQVVGATSANNSAGDFTLPRTGTYLVRVTGGDNWNATGPYQLLVQ